MTGTNPLLVAALAAAERGWHVFPLRPNDKRPAFPDHTAERCTGRDPRCGLGHVGWEGRATTDPERIRRAWSVAPFNVGIACGPSGLLVVDLDTSKTWAEPPEAWQIDGVESGEDVLTILAERAGASLPDLYATHTVRTRCGGRHLYFDAPDAARLGNTAGSLGWLIDTRAHGGYVVAAGSIVDGRRYTTEHDAPTEALPTWLFQQLSPAPRHTAQATAPVPPERRSKYLAATVNAETRHVREARKPGRNHVLFIAAQNLGQLVAGGALTEDEVTRELEQACTGHIGVHGFTAAEAAKTIASGLRAGAKRPRTVAA